MSSTPCTLPAPYPVDSFPGESRKLVQGIIDHTCSDPQIGGSEYVVTVAAAVQHCAMVKIPGHAPIPLGLFIQTVAPSGAGKSLVTNILTRKIREYDDSCRSMDEHRNREFQNGLEEWQDEHEALRQNRRKAIRSGSSYTSLCEKIRDHAMRKPKRLARHGLLRCDISPQSLIEDLASPVGSIFVSHDEGHEFYRSKLAGHLGLLNSAYSGVPLSIDRAYSHRASMRPRLTLSLRIQPAVLKKVIKGKRELFVDSGFFNRMLFVGSSVGRKPATSELREFEPVERTAFDRRVKELLESRGSESHVAPEILELMPEALLEISRMQQLVAQDVSASGPLSDVSGAALRLVENTLRIAAGVKFFLEGPGPISLEYIQFAKAVCVWHLMEFQRLFSQGGGLSQEQADVEKLEDFLKKRTGNPSFFQPGNCISWRVLMTSGPFRGGGAKVRLDEAANSLSRQGKIRIVQGKTYGGATDSTIQLTDEFFCVSGSSNFPRMPSEEPGYRYALRDFSMPCRCLRCRYCGD